MDLNLKLPDKQLKMLDLSNNEKIEYCSPYDISMNGELKEDGYIVVTNKYLYIIDDNGIDKTIAIREIESIVCEPKVGQGLLVVKRISNDYDELLVRFSMKHVSRISYITRGILNIRDDIKKVIVAREFRKTCSICGRPMRGRKTCPKCSGGENVLFKFIKLCASYKLHLIVIACLMLMISFLELVKPKIQQVFIDEYLTTGKGTFKSVMIFFALMLGATLLSIIIESVKYWLCNIMGNGIAMDLRRVVYEKVQKLSMSFINDRRPGAIMNRMTRDTNSIKGFMQEAFSGMFSCIINMIAAIIVMFSISVKLTLITVIFVPISLSISIAFYKDIHRRFHMQWVHSDRINSGLQDVLSGMRIVKSFGTENDEAANFEKLTSDYSKVQIQNEKFWASLYPCLTFIMGLGVYAVSYFGGIGVLEENITLGQLTQLISYAWILFGPLEWMTFLPRRITELITSLERIYDILDEEPDIGNKENSISHDIEGKVEFKNVRFGYHSYNPVLEKIDLSVKPGEMIGLVGASGTGKSTMINLIMRLHDVDDGEILIDGINIENLNVEKYHSQLGIVLQENFLFAGTIYNNLKFAKPDATEEEIIRAAKIANAHDFIMKTPDGYNTYVGEHGFNLSGGERQRLSIARAVLNNPRILILDEATSNLDTESEYLIQKALERLRAGCTTFAIAHRLSTLKDADRLVVLDGHHIAEVGTHNELMEREGIYYKLVTTQLEMQKLKTT